MTLNNNMFYEPKPRYQDHNNQKDWDNIPVSTTKNKNVQVTYSYDKDFVTRVNDVTIGLRVISKDVGCNMYPAIFHMKNMETGELVAVTLNESALKTLASMFHDALTTNYVNLR